MIKALIKADTAEFLRNKKAVLSEEEFADLKYSLKFQAFLEKVGGRMDKETANAIIEAVDEFKAVQK